MRHRAHARDPSRLIGMNARTTACAHSLDERQDLLRGRRFAAVRIEIEILLQVLASGRLLVLGERRHSEPEVGEREVGLGLDGPRQHGFSFLEIDVTTTTAEEVAESILAGLRKRISMDGTRILDSDWSLLAIFEEIALNKINFTIS